MSTRGIDPKLEVNKTNILLLKKLFILIIQVQLSKERLILFKKLSDLFGPETANHYVSPKTNETRQQLSLEELRLRMYTE
jgi:hypothetical protein